jgi:CBS domain containing-hemolysin-like protein
MAARDIVVIMSLLFIFGVGLFVMNFAMTTSVDQLLNNTQVNSSAGAVKGFTSVKVIVNRLDYIIFALFIGLTVSLIVSGWFIGGNAIFMFIYFIIVGITVAISTVLSNVWQQISVASVFGATVSSFPITNHLLTYLPYYVATVGLIGLIVMFAKPYFEGGY